jgi:hypothetical protein
MPENSFPHNLNIIVQSESEERQIHDLVELLLDRRRLEAMITHGLSVDLALEILRDRQRQASDAASASPEAKQKT